MTDKQEVLMTEETEKRDHGHVASALDTEKAIAPAEDIAAEFLAAHQNEQPWTDVELKTVVRRIDYLLMPLMFATYMFNYTDKLLMSLGANFGMVEDLDLFVMVNGKENTKRYSDANTIYYMAFLVGIPLFAILAQRLPTAKVCATAVTLWGIISALTAAVQTYPGAMVHRAALGFAEAGVLPCFVLMTASFYTKHEQTLRVGIWYAGASGSYPLSFIVNYGLLHIQGSIAAWRIMCIFWGLLTAVFGIACFKIMPDTPMQAWNLSERQRYIATERLRVNQSGVANRHFKRSQVWEALKDVKVYIPGLVAFCLSSANSLQSAFNPILFHNLLKASEWRSMVLGIPDHLITVIATLISGFVTAYVPNTAGICALVWEITCLVGAVCLWTVHRDNEAGLFAGIFLMSTFLGAVIVVYGFNTANIAGNTKKTVASIWLIVCVKASNAASPQLFKSSEAPKYTSGFIAIAIMMMVAIALTMLYTFLSWKENRRRDVLGEEGRVDRAFMDLTDKENLSFRYIL